MRTFVRLVVVVAIAVLGLAPAAHAVVLFSDNFDADATALGTASGTAPLINWNVTVGSIDVIQSGTYGITCAGGAGKCLDMDGSTAQAGKIVSKQVFSLLAGKTYELSFDVSGNQRGYPPDSLTGGVEGVGSGTPQPFNSNAPFTTETISITVGGSVSGSLFFQAAGGDNVGPILDNVTFECTNCDAAAVPEPSTLLLLGSTLSGLAGVAWRRRR